MELIKGFRCQIRQKYFLFLLKKFELHMFACEPLLNITNFHVLLLTRQKVELNLFGASLEDYDSK